MTPYTIFLVGFSGGLGAIGRYAIGISLNSHWPWGTLFVNLLGAFLMGILMNLVLSQKIDPQWALILGAGFLGGFTTFSALSFEAFSMIKNGQYTAAALYIGLSIIGGVIGSALGWLSVNV